MSTLSRARCSVTPRFHILRANLEHVVLHTNKSIRQHNRTVVQVGASNVAQPAHLVEHGRQGENHAAHGDGFANDVQFFPDRYAGQFQRMHADLRRRYARPLSPQAKSTGQAYASAADVCGCEGVSERARCIKEVDEGVNSCAPARTSSK